MKALHRRARSRQTGMLLPAVLAAITAMSWLAVHVHQLSITTREQHASVNRAQEVVRKADRMQAVHRAAALLSAESTLPADGYPLAPAPALVAGQGPAGGGFVPATSRAPAMADGKALGYCAWDNGADAATAGYLPGLNAPASTVLAVVHPGADGVFQTSCADAVASITQADDFVVVVATTQIRQMSDLPHN